MRRKRRARESYATCPSGVGLAKSYPTHVFRQTKFVEYATSCAGLRDGFTFQFRTVLPYQIVPVSDCVFADTDCGSQSKYIPDTSHSRTSTRATSTTSNDRGNKAAAFTGHRQSTRDDARDHAGQTCSKSRAASFIRPRHILIQPVVCTADGVSGGSLRCLLG